MRVQEEREKLSIFIWWFKDTTDFHLQQFTHNRDLDLATKSKTGQEEHKAGGACT
jgi:hypothetical protein